MRPGDNSVPPAPANRARLRSWLNRIHIFDIRRRRRIISPQISAIHRKPSGKVKTPFVPSVDHEIRWKNSGRNLALPCLNGCVNELSLPATDRPTDEELARLVAAGQVEVFAQLYTRYYARAYRLAWAMTGQREAAEELTQEIFLRAWQKAGQFSGESSFGTWFYRLATHCCLNYRKRLPARAHESLDAVEQTPQTDAMKQIEANVRQQEIQGEVQRALLSLKPEWRLIVILKDIEGLSYEEIAERIRERKMFFAFVKQLIRPGCWRYQRQLSPYLDAELEQAASARLETHLAGCTACRTQCENLSFAARLVANLPMPETEPATTPLWVTPEGAAQPLQQPRRLVFILAPAVAVLALSGRRGVVFPPRATSVLGSRAPLRPACDRSESYCQNSAFAYRRMVGD